MIYMLLADGFEEVEALCPLDLLRRAGLPIQTVSVGRSLVKGAHGIAVQADLTPEAVKETPEMLVLPGGMPGTLNLDASPLTDCLLQAVIANGGRIAAICAAPLILGRRGLLKGKRAVCYPGFEDELVGAEIPNTSVVTDGLITTAVGMGVACEFGLELISLLTTPEKAAQIADAIRYEKH